MALNADTLLDRMRLKAQVSRWRILAIVALVMALMVIFDRHSMHSPIESPYIARVSIEDVIYDDAGRDKLLAKLQEDKKVKAIILRLNTPGGSAVGGEELFLRLREISKVKPVVAVMRDLAASAGYMTALGADRIYAREGTLTGSIGVIIQTAEFSELAQKIGITPVTVKTGPLKDALSPYKKATPEAVQVMQDVVDDFYRVFVDMVAERRKLPREEVVKLADGRVFTGAQALNYKLIDALGGEQDAVTWLEEERKLDKDLDIRDADVKEDDMPWIKHLTNEVFEKIVPTASAGLDGLAAIWHPSVQIQ